MDNRFLELKNNRLRVTFSSLGASIVAIYFDDELMTLTPVNLEDLKRRDIYYGKTIGPIANRLKGGLIKIDDKKYHLPLNKEGISNHSGILGLSNKLFVSKKVNNRIIFTYQQKIDDINISYGIAYTLEEESLRIDYVARTSDKMMLSLTNHTFFTLGEPSIDNLSLKVSSDEYIESDGETLLPETIKPIIDCLDFNKEKSLIKDIDNPYLKERKAKGYDHAFVLKNKEGVILKSPKYMLEIESDYPCVHIYTDNYSDGVKTKNSGLPNRRGTAIECVDNYLDRPIISKDEVYQRYIEYKFKKI